jgi:16S rRNA (uracil1498-N3)-methyltransferase
VTAPLFFVDAVALTADRIIIDGAEGRHAADVRRLRAGEVVDVGDGQGRIARGVVAEVQRGRIVVEVEKRHDVPMASPRFVVAQALAKGGRDLDAVEAMTEVGVDEVVAWQAERSVAKSSARTLERWQATAVAATKQSHRAWVPTVAGPGYVDDVATLLRGATLGIVLHEEATSPLSHVRLPNDGDVVIVVGPEGGLSVDELAAFGGTGAGSYRLGESVLRTSTAGVAALSVLSAMGRWR